MTEEYPFDKLPLDLRKNVAENTTRLIEFLINMEKTGQTLPAGTFMALAKADYNATVKNLMGLFMSKIQEDEALNKAHKKHKKKFEEFVDYCFREVLLQLLCQEPGAGHA